MSSNQEEVITMNKVITEETQKETDKINNKLEKIIDTVVAEGAKVVAENLGLKMISESNLLDNQKILASSIYDSVKESVKGFISDPSVNNTLKITKVIGQVIKQLEKSKASGADKKAVAIQLGRILIKEVTPDDKGEAEILMVYDMIAEQTLETMIEVSKVVNVAIQKVAAKCCPGFLELFKRAKTTA